MNKLKLLSEIKTAKEQLQFSPETYFQELLNLLEYEYQYKGIECDILNYLLNKVTILNDIPETIEGLDKIILLLKKN